MISIEFAFDKAISFENTNNDMIEENCWMVFNELEHERFGTNPKCGIDSSTLLILQLGEGKNSNLIFPRHNYWSSWRWILFNTECKCYSKQYYS